MVNKYYYNEFDLTDTLTELGLKHRGVNRRKELQLFKCPFCEIDRQKKSDHFSFRVDTGQFKCIKCEEQGNLITFRRKMGVDPYQKSFHKIDQKKAENYRKQSDEYYERFSRSRSISVETLKKYGVGKVVDKALGVCRTYQYVDLDGSIVNVKYVNKDKHMKMEYGAKKIYYGLQFVDFEKDYLHVVSGEDDVHALVDMDIDNVVSVPAGDKSYSPDIGKINAKFKKLFLLFDNDKPGQEGAKGFSHKAGVWKCYNVLLPFNDSRECLQNGIDIFGIEKLKGEAKQFEYSPEDKCRPALGFHERWNRYTASLKAGDGLMTGYEVIDGVVGGFRPGEVMGVVANPGAYKTALLMNFVIRIASRLNYGFVMFFSLEMAIESEFERELSIITGKTRSYIKDSYENPYTGNTIKSESEGKLSRVMVSEESYINLADMLKIIKRTEEVFGEPCVMVACDYADFVESEGSKKEYETIKEVANGFKSRICRVLGIPGIMLYQTSRNNKNSSDEVTARSGKGGTPIEASGDFQLGLWRNKGIVGRFTKHRRISDKWNGGQWPYFKLVIHDMKTFEIVDIIKTERPVNNANEEEF